jgi:hypothetical protein
MIHQTIDQMRRGVWPAEALPNAKRIRKACGCRGTNSGPRAVCKDITPGGRLDPERYTTKCSLAPMVCDVCNTPWEVIR